ncbi:uroporphyrinogen-III C-methyltransferase [Thalassomonas sp. M1454]|uniref:uroporphyrinogen-III C-methyltransferase n=1 Tax=Thalassomonas sp. M1454 TaxID=2594477 RepID=UPI00117BE954|nr:uroporphyrinogen-III C-methyltransferase [Thalassomonas sp. M1454]TRX55177.1 hypothetical protein FNN08_11355 [Thalassomonas sp. M1454]
MTDKDNKKASNDLDAGASKATESGKASETNTTKPKISAAQATKIAAQAKLGSKEKVSDTSAKAAKNKKAASSKVTSKVASTKSTTPNLIGKQKLSKTAVFAVLLALTAGAGVGGHYWWQQQVDAENAQLVDSKIQANIEQLDRHLQKQISSLQAQSKQQATEMIREVEKRSGSRIAELEQEIELILERQPNNWQVTEAEYLVRMAGRVLWLEKDTKTAISLMQDADQRLADLKDPRLLEVRQLLRNDIEELKLLPSLKTDEVIMTFMGLAQQIKKLPLLSVQLPEETELQESTALSTDINDWQANLAKSWEKFKAEFITIRRRSGDVEPLMEPEFEQNLYHNLDLKIQQVQWAASKRDSKLYVASITNIQQWLSMYFDMTASQTQQFNARLVELKSMPVNVDYPQSLSSQQALRAIMDRAPTSNAPKKKMSTLKPSTVNDEPMPEKAEPEQKSKQTVKPEQSAEAKA